MAKEKKNGTKEPTKAGMMSENSDRTADEKDRTESKTKIGDAPKVSKESAEGQHGDKPLH